MGVSIVNLIDANINLFNISDLYKLKSNNYISTKEYTFKETFLRVCVI